MKSKYWVLILMAVLLLCLGLSAYLFRPGQQAQWAEVWSEGQLVERIFLGTDRQLTVESKNGTNVITVQDGKIGVTEADCLDHYCMDRGFCSGGAQIVCLPNRLVIRFIDGQGMDGVVG